MSDRKMGIMANVRCVHISGGPRKTCGHQIFPINRLDAQARAVTMGGLGLMICLGIQHLASRIINRY